MWNRNSSVYLLTDREQAELDTWVNVTRYETRQINHTSIDASLKELNLTGIKSAEKPSSLNEFIPQQLQEPVSEVWHEESEAHVYFNNISSILHGSFWQLPPPPKLKLDLNRYNQSLANYSLALQHTGKISLSISETVQHNASRLLQASVFLADENEVLLSGFYLPDGRVVMASYTLKFAGTKALPWLTPQTPGREDSKDILVDLIGNSTHEQTFQDFSQRLESSQQCEWVLWGHSRSSHYSQEELDEIEKELANPEGRPVNSNPPVELNGVLYSPDCGLAIKVEVTGERVEYYKARLRHVLVYLLLIFVCAHVFTIYQVQRCNTPSATFRVSFWSIAIMTLTDGLVCMTCMFSFYEKEFALQLMTITVEVFCFITIVQLEYLVAIFYSQLRGSSSRYADLNQSQVSALIYGRLYLVLLGLSLVTISSYGFAENHRKVYEYSLLFVLYSNWWPQVWRNTHRGISRPFSLAYMYGVSVTRLIPILYVCFYPKNVGYHHFDPILGWAVLAWQWLQLILLTAQYIFGGQFFLPDSMTSGTYNYHPILTSDLEAALFTTDLPVQDAASEDDRFKQVDCPICMSPINLVVSQSTSPSTVLARRKYMVTPCRHVFHTNCLEEWTRRKLECPVCRTSLPCS